MSQKPRVVVAVLATAATLAAVQIAASQSASTATLADRFEAASERPTVEPWSGPIWDAVGINRTAKGNREAVPRGAAPSRTVLLKSDPLANTSVLVRFPHQNDTRYLPAPLAKPASAKMAAACEPTVSLLTEVAKLLQPGKCVT